MAYSVSFSGVSPGTYYVEVFFKAPGSTRRLSHYRFIWATELITLNGSKVTSNSLNGSQITNETVNGVQSIWLLIRGGIKMAIIKNLQSRVGC